MCMANGKREFVAQHVTRFFPLLVFNNSFLLQKLSSFSLFSSLRIVLNCFICWVSILRNSQQESAVCHKRDFKSLDCYFVTRRKITQLNEKPSICVVIAQQMSPSHQIRLSVRLYTQVFAVHTTGWGSLVGGRFGVTLCSPGNNSPSYKFSVENKARKKSKDRPKYATGRQMSQGWHVDR